MAANPPPGHATAISSVVWPSAPVLKSTPLSTRSIAICSVLASTAVWRGCMPRRIWQICPSPPRNSRAIDKCLDITAPCKAVKLFKSPPELQTPTSISRSTNSSQPLVTARCNGERLQPRVSGLASTPFWIASLKNPSCCFLLVR